MPAYRIEYQLTMPAQRRKAQSIQEFPTIGDALAWAKEQALTRATADFNWSDIEGEHIMVVGVFPHQELHPSLLVPVSADLDPRIVRHLAKIIGYAGETLYLASLDHQLATRVFSYRRTALQMLTGETPASQRLPGDVWRDLRNALNDYVLPAALDNRAPYHLADAINEALLGCPELWLP